VEAVRPTLLQSRIVAREPLSPRAFELRLTRPPGFAYAAGQRITIVFEGAERDYSLASAPHEPEVRLCIRAVEGGEISGRLENLYPGSALAFHGPHGYFTFKPTGRTPVFVATGSGVAPFRAMAVAGAAGYVLLHGVDSPADLYYADVLRSAAARYVPCISGPEAARVPGGFAGRVTDYLRQRLPAESYDVYACGRRDMVRDVTLLADERFPDSLVFAEMFY
jgi:ferredoxin-NADP reductase